MTSNARAVLLGSLAVLTAGLVALFWAVFASTPTTGQLGAAARDSATVIGIVTAASVGIERAIEALWTLVGNLSKSGSWWPLNQVGSSLQQYESLVNANLTPIFAKARTAVQDAQNAGQMTAEELTNAQNELTQLEHGLQQLNNATPGNQRVKVLTTSAQQTIAYIQQKYPYTGVESDVAIANQAVDALAQFTASFQDNPARRIISLYLASYLGLAVAWALGLNLFAALLTPQGNGHGLGIHLQWGVALTGLVIGLGSSPTHEVIRILQEAKESRKAGNDASAADGGNGSNGGNGGGGNGGGAAAGAAAGNAGVGNVGAGNAGAAQPVPADPGSVPGANLPAESGPPGKAPPGG